MGDASTSSRLPIVAFMAGRFMDEMQGMRFGHAGTIVEGKEDTATEKIERLRGGRASRSPSGSRRSRTLIQKRLAERSAEADAGHLHRRRGRRRRSPSDAALAKKLEEVCPVDIFAPDDGRRAARSSRRTSTSACSATSASRRRPPGTRARRQALRVGDRSMRKPRATSSSRWRRRARAAARDPVQARRG